MKFLALVFFLLSPPYDLTPCGSGSGSELTTGGTPTTSTAYFGPPEYPFDNSGSTQIIQPLPSWVAYEFGAAKMVCVYSITPHSGDESSMPTLFKLQAWDGAAWVDVDARSHGAWSGAETFELSSSTSSTKWRVYMTEAGGASQSIIGDVGMYENTTPYATATLTPTITPTPTNTPTPTITLTPTPVEYTYDNIHAGGQAMGLWGLLLVAMVITLAVIRFRKYGGF